MSDQVNKQIVDAVVVVNERLLVDAVSESQGVTLESYAYSISLFMINAVSTQYSAAQIANAAVATTCAEIIKAASVI